MRPNGRRRNEPDGHAGKHACRRTRRGAFALLLGEDGPLVGQAEAAGVQVIVAPFPRALARLGDSGSGPLGALWSCVKAAAGTIGYARSLRRTLAELQPDIVHTNGFKMHVLGAWARPENTPVIWHVRDYVSTRPLMKWLLRCTPAAVRQRSETLRAWRAIFKRCAARQLETLCIYNAIDLKRYSPTGEKTDLDSLSGLAPAPAGTVRIGLAATLAHWKGHAVFLRALARLPKDLPYPRVRDWRCDLSNREQPANCWTSYAPWLLNWESPTRLASPGTSQTPPARFGRSISWFTPARSPSRSAA